MKKPDVCRIGQLKFDIEYPDTVINDDQEVLYGQSRTFEQKILVASRHSLLRQKATLLHESIHAIDEWYNFNRLEESHVTQMTHGLFDFMRDNRDLIRWIIED